MPPKSRMVFIILTACLITAWVGESLAASGPDYDEILAQSVQEQLRALELDQLSALRARSNQITSSIFPIWIGGLSSAKAQTAST